TCNVCSTLMFRAPDSGQPQGLSVPSTHIAKYCEPPPYAWPRERRTPSTWCSPAVPRACIAASKKRSMPEAPIGLDERTPPEAFQGMSPPSSEVAPSSVSFQPSPSGANPKLSNHIGSYQLKGT